MNIRLVEKRDNPLLASLIRAVFDEHKAPREGTVYVDKSTDELFELFQTPKSTFWVAELNGVLVGCCGIFPTKGLPTHCAELAKFYLLEQARGKGIGKALITQALDSAKDLGYKEVYLESHPVWQKAVGMYTKLGFQHLDQPMGNSGHTACTIWMKKDL